MKRDNPYVPPEARRSASVGGHLRSRWRILWYLAAVAILFATPFVVCPYCYAMGSSAINDVIVRDRITTRDGHPHANETVDLVLDKTYGLSASEARDPERFGNRTRIEQVTTDSSGEFTHSFGIVVYHVDFFWVPFRIRIPKDPSPFVFSMRFPRISSVPYLVHAPEGWYKPRRASVASLIVREEQLEQKGAVTLTAFVEIKLKEPTHGKHQSLHSS